MLCREANQLQQSSEGGYVWHCTADTAIGTAAQPGCPAPGEEASALCAASKYTVQHVGFGLPGKSRPSRMALFPASYNRVSESAPLSASIAMSRCATMYHSVGRRELLSVKIILLRILYFCFSFLARLFTIAQCPGAFGFFGLGLSASAGLGPRYSGTVAQRSTVTLFGTVLFPLLSGPTGGMVPNPRGGSEGRRFALLSGQSPKISR